jgi:hypothetical protein
VGQFSRARAAFACLLIALAVWLYVAKASARMPDFEVYWRAGARAVAAEPLYRSEFYELKYFPAFAILAIPLGMLPHDAAKVAWFALSAGALVALLPLSVAILPDRRKSTTFLIWALLIGLGKYYAEDLVLGQINTLVALAVTCTILAFAARREALAGALLAFAVVLKPYALILVPWVLARRRPRSIVAVTIGLIIGCALPLLFYSFDETIALHRDWWHIVTTTTGETLLDQRNVSLASTWAKWLGIGPAAAWLATGISAALLLAAAVVFLRRNGVAHPDGLEAGMLIAMTPLISPQGWDYVLVLATVAMVYVVNDIGRLPRLVSLPTYTAIAAIGLSLYDLVGRRILNILLDLSVITVGMLVLMGALVTLRMRKLA